MLDSAKLWEEEIQSRTFGGLCRWWNLKKRVEDVGEKWYSEILAENGEADDGDFLRKWMKKTLFDLTF